MKAALIHSPGDVRVETVPDPVIKSDEALVKVRACGICGTDVHYYRAGDPSMAGEPLIPGHEFSGEIVEIGADVKGLAIGDRVIGTGLRDCGKCYWCRNGLGFCPNPRVPGEGLDGAMAEFVVIPDPMVGKLVFPIPPNLSWEQAATIEPMAVSCYAVEEARPREKPIVVVLGAGAIGLGIVQACRAAGAARIIVSEPSEVRREMAVKLGADVVINPIETDPVNTITQNTSGHLANIIFECSGSASAFRQAPLMIQPFGKIMQVGIFERNLQITPELSKLMFQFRNATIRGCGGQRWDRALELIGSGAMSLDSIISHTYPLEDIAEAFETQQDPERSIKVIVRI